MKTSMKEITWYIFISLFALTLEGCNDKTVKQEKTKKMQPDTLITNTDSASVSKKKDFATQNAPEPQTIVQKTSKQNTASKAQNISQKSIDLNKIYEQSEVIAARWPLSNSQFMEFHNKNFKYPNIEPINGNGLADLVIEADGTVSDVIIVKGIQPDLDKEFRRVYMLLPKFIPGRINETAVRSKLRFPILSRFVESEK